MRPLFSLALLVVASSFGCGARSTGAPVIEMRSMGANSADARSLPQDAEAQRAFAVGKFGFVETIGDRRVLLLATDVDVAWGKGPAELVSKTDEPLRIARVPIAPGALPESHRVSGFSVDLYDGDKMVAEMPLGTVWIAGMTYDFDEPRQPSSEPRPSSQWIAEDARKNGTRWLVADLGSAVPKEVDWARLSILPNPELPAMTPAEPEVYQRAEALLRREQQFASAQESFEAHYASINQPKPTDRWEDSGDLRVTTFTHRGQRFAYARIEGGEACSFNAIIARLYRINGAALEPAGELTSYDVPEVLLDSDGDGELEAARSSTFGAGWKGLEKFIGDENRALLSNSRPEHFCPC